MSFVRSRIDIVYPYRHSTGPMVGPALGALQLRRIIGARCSSCGAVSAPARDWCERCGAEAGDLVEVGPGGVVSEAARVHEPTEIAPLDSGFAWALVRLDGADTDLLHAVRAGVRRGDRVRPVWREQRRGAITDIVCFEPEDEGASGAPTGTAAARADDALGVPDPVPVFERTVSLPYTLTAGALLSRFFEDVLERRALHGVRCGSCGMVIVPPLPACATCWADTEGWIPVSDRGTVTTFVVVNVPFHGMEMPMPYVLARVLLDGADTSMLHVLGEVEPGAARMGMRVEAVWDEQRTGFPADDIRYFRPTGEPDVPAERFIDRL